jgi:hypothetical protein
MASNLQLSSPDLLLSKHIQCLQDRNQEVKHKAKPVQKKQGKGHKRTTEYITTYIMQGKSSSHAILQKKKKVLIYYSLPNNFQLIFGGTLTSLNMKSRLQSK